MGIRPKNSEFLKRALWAVSAKMLQAAMAPHRGQVFSIGIYRGSSPTHFADPPDIDNPVLTRADVTDIPAAFVADPFMLRRDGRWYMFMEILNRITRRGVIGLAVSEDGATWRYQRVVLEEPFHMAYPQILRD